MESIVIVGHHNPMLLNFRGDLITKMIRDGYEVHIVGPDDKLKNELLDLGISSFTSISMNRTGVNFVKDLRYTYNLYRSLRKIKPDIILNVTIKPVIYGSIAAKLAGVKSINSMLTGIGFIFVSNTVKAKIIKRFVLILYKIALSFSTNVIFQNNDDLIEFVSYGLVKRDKCKVVNGSGVNLSRFKKCKLPKVITFFMTSRFLYAKGVLEYLEAARIVKAKYEEVKFVILGEFDDKADCIPYDKVSHYFKNQIVEYLGVTNDVPKLLAMSSVYVLPSYREGVPRSVLEAMSMGRPIITTDVPGCRDTVVNGENGFLVPKKNVNALVEKMEWFIQNPEAIEIMGLKSYELCINKFDVAIINSKMMTVMNL